MKKSLNDNLLKNISGGFTTLLGRVDTLSKEELKYLASQNITVFDKGKISLYGRILTDSLNVAVPNSKIMKILISAGFKETK